jgi:hypothetical protein
MKRQTEYENFTDLMGKIIKVPHGEIKAKLDAEKRAKKRKKYKRLLSTEGSRTQIR